MTYNQSATTLIHCQVSFSLSLGILQERIRMQTPAKSFLSFPPRAGDVHLGPRTTWMKTIQADLSSLDLELHEARELAQNRPLWRLMYLYSTRSGACCYWIRCGAMLD